MATKGNSFESSTSTYQCDICKRFCRTKQSIAKHIALVHSDLPRPKQKCETCDYETNDAKSLKIHVSVIHRKEKNFKCQYCSEAFYYHDMRKEHETEVHFPNIRKEFKCGQCTFVTHNNRLFNAHKNWHHRKALENQSLFTCTICDKSYKRENSLWYHMYYIHDRDKKPIKCNICDIEFKYKVDYYTHRDNEHGEQAGKGHPCDLCGAILKTKGILRQHKKIHKAEKKYECDLCEYKGACKMYLTKHIKAVHHGQKNKTIQCEKCSYRAFSKERLDKHFKNMHTVVPKLTCNQCDFATKYSQSLDTHINAVHRGLRPHKCEVCKSAFTQLTHLRTHKKTHQANSLHECGECEEKFSTHNKLRHHHMRRHGNRTQLKCEICGFTTLSKPSLKLHKRTIHLEKTFICDEKNCGKEYADQYRLREHTAHAHLNVYPFKCENCDKQFKTRPGLKLHLQKCNYVERTSTMTTPIQPKDYSLKEVVIALPDIMKTITRNKNHQ